MKETPPPDLRTTKPKCLFPTCKNEPSARGLCKNHYTVATRLVKAGQVSWEQLEKGKRAGTMTDRATRRGKAQRWFLDALTVLPAPDEAPAAAQK